MSFYLLISTCSLVILITTFFVIYFCKTNLQPNVEVCENIKKITYRKTSPSFYSLELDTHNNLYRISQRMLEIVQQDKIFPYSYVKMLTHQFNSHSSNWFTKDIEIPKFFMISLFLMKEEIFDPNNKYLKNITDLLDKIFTREVKPRDIYSNGYDVMLYYFIYYKLHRLYPNICKKYANFDTKIKEFSTQLDIEYKYNEYKTYLEEGFYPDGSFIYHKDVPYSLGYLIVLLEDYYYFKKFDLYKINENNLKKIYSSVISNVYGNYIPLVVTGRGISRPRMPDNVLQTMRYMEYLFNINLDRDLKDMYAYVNVNYNKLNFEGKITNDYFNKNKKYIKPLDGIYAWYGENYDNYIIYGGFNKTTVETVDHVSDGDLMYTTNYRQAISFGDEPYYKWLRFINDNVHFQNQFFTGAILNDQNKMTSAYKGYLTEFPQEMFKNEQISIVTKIIELDKGKYIHIIYVVDRIVNGITVFIETQGIEKKEAATFITCGLLSDKTIIINKSKDLLLIESSLETRIIHSTQPHEIKVDNRYSTFKKVTTSIPITYVENGGFASCFLSKSLDYKIPTIDIDIENGIKKYSNGNTTFTFRNIKNNESVVIQPTNVRNFFLLEFTYKNEKYVLGINYPYWSDTPQSINGIEFLWDEKKLVKYAKF